MGFSIKGKRISPNSLVGTDMQVYLNDHSLQGQFEDHAQFRAAIEALIRTRQRSDVLRQMRTSTTFSSRMVSHGHDFRAVASTWKGTPLLTAVLAWVGKYGPFIEDDRQTEEDDLFEYLTVDVTEGGLGEAARRVKRQEHVATLSFCGGLIDYAVDPLDVVHGLAEAPLGTYVVKNFWDVKALEEAALNSLPPALCWKEMVEHARSRFPNLLLPDAIYGDDRLVREPFDPVIRDRFYALLGQLDRYMGDRPGGVEGAIAQSIVKEHFHGDRAAFSGESKSNQDNFKGDMTFTDPSDVKGTLFAHWHGKISHKFYRLHFEWPVPATQPVLKVLYVGPKLTKA